MTEEELRELFREMRDEPVPADSQARVRLVVAERTRSWRERFRWHWKIAAAILAPVCVVLIAMLAREPARVVLKPAALETPAEAGAPPVTAVPAASAPHRPARVVHHAVTARNNVDTGTVIRIETPDPDVVILLVGG